MIRKLNWAKFKRISYIIHSNVFRSCKINVLRNVSVVRYSGFFTVALLKIQFFRDETLSGNISSTAKPNIQTNLLF